MRKTTIIMMMKMKMIKKKEEKIYREPTSISLHALATGQQKPISKAWMTPLS